MRKVAKRPDFMFGGQKLDGRAAKTASDESAAVRERIREAHHLLAQDTGIVELNALYARLQQNRVMVSRYRLPVLLTEIPPLAVVGGTWVAAIAEQSESILTKRLRKLLAIRPRVSLTVVQRQLIRTCIAYSQLPLAVLRDFAVAHDDFWLDGDRLACHSLLLPKQELDAAEWFVFGVLAGSPRSRTADEVTGVAKGRHGVTDTQVLLALRTSVIVSATDGGYTLVKHDAVRSTPEPPEYVLPPPEPTPEPPRLDGGAAIQLSFGAAWQSGRIAKRARRRR